MNAQKWAEDFAVKLEDDAAVRGIKEAYQADGVAFDLVFREMTHRDEEMSMRASRCAYRRELSRNSVLAVLQVVLRDVLINQLQLDDYA